MRLRFPLAALVLLFALIIFNVNADANHVDDPLGVWRGHGPTPTIAIAFNSNVTPEHEALYRHAIATWNDTGYVRLILVPWGDHDIRLFSGDGNFGGVSTGGGTKIRSGVASLGPFANSRTATHEVGHALGMDHTTTGPSIMGGGGTGNDCPGAHDLRFLSQYYKQDKGKLRLSGEYLTAVTCS